MTDDMRARLLPTGVFGERVDLSAYPAIASATAEPYLAPSYALIKTMPCACGGSVTADIDCPAAGVRAHQATSEHQAYRRAFA